MAGNKRVVSLQCPYGSEVTLRRSGLSKNDWSYVLKRFGVTRDPETVEYIRVVGEDDFGHLLVDIMVEET